MLINIWIKKKIFVIIETTGMVGTASQRKKNSTTLNSEVKKIFNFYIYIDQDLFYSVSIFADLTLLPL